MKLVNHNPTLQMYICITVLGAVYYFIGVRNQSVFDWDIMSPSETCISILICISG